MAMAIMILSNEGGRDVATIVAASRDEAKAVAGIAKRATGAKYLGVETMAARKLIDEAILSMGEKWAMDYVEPQKAV